MGDINSESKTLNKTLDKPNLVLMNCSVLLPWEVWVIPRETLIIIVTPISSSIAVIIIVIINNNTNTNNKTALPSSHKPQSTK